MLSTNTHKSTNVRAVVYGRVSKDDRINDGRNLDSQIEMGGKYCLEKNYDIIEKIKEDERGACGADIDLPGLNQIRQMAKAKQFDVLVVRELDRLSRNLAKQLIVEEELNRQQILIEYVLTEYADSPEGRLQKHVKAVLSEYEREKITERIVRGRTNKIRKGQTLSAGRAPYGYRPIIKDGKSTFEIFDIEANVIRLIFQFYLQDGLSMRAIAMRLTEMGAPLPKKNIKPGRMQIWFASSVGKFIKNESYAGVWYYGKYNSKTGEKHKRENWIAVNIPAIIDRETWQAAQIKATTNSERSKRNSKYNYLLSHRLTCGYCGCKCGGKKNKINFYYGCYGKGNREMLSNCTLPYFRADKVDAITWQWIKSLLTNPENLEQGLQDYQSQKTIENKPLTDRLAIIENLLADNKAQLTRLLDLYLGGDFPKELLTERKQRLETTIIGLEREHLALTTQVEATALTQEQIQSIKEFAFQVTNGLELVDSNFETRQKIVDLLDVHATLAFEKEQRVIYLQCKIGTTQTLITSTTTGGSALAPASWTRYCAGCFPTPKTSACWKWDAARAI